MYGEIKKRIEERFREGSRFCIERIASKDLESKRDILLISNHATSELKRHLSEMNEITNLKESATLTRKVVDEFGGLGTLKQLEKHFFERIYVDISNPKEAFDFTVPSGSRVFGPPYDLDWSEGNGVGFLSRFDGQVYTIPKANGFSAAGIGFYLTTNEPVLAAITPQGTYKWNWSGVKEQPFLRSMGGMGITIYTNSDQQPTMSRQPVLWSISGIPTMFLGDTGSGRIADAASPAFGLGTVPLAPALLNMVPGSRYLVWVWCWQTSQLEEEESGFIAFLSFLMPFVTIDAGPPIVIH
jgi:hypothetical protein